MKARLFFLSFLVTHATLWAQDSTIVTLKTGDTIKDVLKSTDIFLFPEFTNSMVYFRDGAKARALINYNYLTDQMLFIDAKGDTLALQNEQTIKFIALGTDTFLYNEGYIRVIESNNVVKLAERQVWELADIRKIGSHNRPATTFAITSYNTVTDRFGKTHDLVLNEDVVIRKKATYYFGDKYNNFSPALKKNLLMLFPKEEDRLSKYLKANNVKFDKKDDLVKVTQFLGQKY